MSGFSAEWLALREPVDHVARAASVTAFVAHAVASRAALVGADLGCGTGSNVRYLAPFLPSARAWRLLDHDAALLGVAQRLLTVPTAPTVIDLHALDAQALDGCGLVTASALLDLVSDAWLVRFVELCRHAGAAVLFALNYDGRMACAPADPDDDLVRDLVNRHQRTDKGLGAALGPDSGPRTAAVLREAGYDVRVAKSDWQMGPDQAELQRQLIEGWVSAAVEMSPADADRIQAWRTRRLAHLDAGRSHIVVGHDDVGGVLRG